MARKEHGSYFGQVRLTGIGIKHLLQRKKLGQGWSRNLQKKKRGEKEQHPMESKDAHFCWLLFSLCRDTSALVYAVKRSCENKAEVVALDEREGGVRATLNLGHTFGHVSSPPDCSQGCNHFLQKRVKLSCAALWTRWVWLVAPFHNRIAWIWYLVILCGAGYWNWNRLRSLASWGGCWYGHGKLHCRAGGIILQCCCIKNSSKTWSIFWCLQFQLSNTENALLKFVIKWSGSEKTASSKLTLLLTRTCVNVLLGQIMAAHMSLKMGWIDQSLFDRTLELSKRAKLPVTPPGCMDVQTFKDIMAVSPL